MKSELDVDVYRSANLLIKQFGKLAMAYADDQMAQFIEKDDVKGATVWWSISSAVEELQALPPVGERH